MRLVAGFPRGARVVIFKRTEWKGKNMLSVDDLKRLEFRELNTEENARLMNKIARAALEEEDVRSNGPLPGQYLNAFLKWLVLGPKVAAVMDSENRTFFVRLTPLSDRLSPDEAREICNRLQTVSELLMTAADDCDSLRMHAKKVNR